MWTFGICFYNDEFIDGIIKSIKNQNNLKKEKFEIILVGPYSDNVKSLLTNNIDINYYIFDESIRPGWITAKKNFIIQNSKFDNVCFLHDYIGLCEGWYDGYEQFGYDWDVCMNPVRMKNGLRHRDWFTQHRPLKFLDYSDNSKTNQMYINGAYWCAKKNFMSQNPLNNNLIWGMGEDVEWGMRCQSKWKYKLNPYSVVRYLKDKPLSDWNPHPDIDPNKSAEYENKKIQQ